MVSVLIFLSLLLQTSAQVSYTRTPAGLVLSHCVHGIESGSEISELPDGSLNISHPQDGKSKVIPVCDTHNGAYPVVLGKVTQNQPTGRAREALGGLPADYDGWLQYTAYYDEEGFDSFVGSFTVPDNPASRPDILYLFTGLQNIDWIPKVDPEPTAVFDIIQPVIQYPASFGKHWSVKSWYVTLQAGALYSNELPLKTGDVVYGAMNRTGPQSWTVSSTIQSSGKTTTQKVTNERLKSQPWAYTTLECYGCKGCDTYPQSPVNFTGMSLGKQGVPVSQFEWKKNPKPQPDQKCHEDVAIIDQKTVSYSFQ